MSNERVPWSKDLDKMKYCPECGARRGNQKANWAPVLRKDQIIGWTCPECPTNDEPIRRWGKTRERFRAVVDITPAGSRQRKQATKTFGALEDARAWVSKVKAEVAANGSVERTKLTVNQLLDDWLETVQVRPPTKIRYMDQAKPVRRFMGDVPVVDLKVSHVEDLTNWMRTEGKADGSGYGKWSITAARQRLSQALDMAVRRDIVSKNVVAYALPLKVDRVVGEEVEHWKVEGSGDEAVCPDRSKFLTVSDEERLAPLWRLTLCGATRADVMGLRWRDLDLENGIADISRGRVILTGSTDHVDEPKSLQRYRGIEFEAALPGTIDHFEALKDRQKVEAMEIGRVWSEDDFVATNEIGKPMRPELYSDQFKRLCVRAGVPVIRLHAVRHTIALLLDRKGLDSEYGATLLGHTKKVHEDVYKPRDRSYRSKVAAKALAM